MAEYISCRRCDSTDCKDCNLKRLETMLANGKFDCLMNENRSVNTSYDVAPVVHGRWHDVYMSGPSSFTGTCSACGVSNDIPYPTNAHYCPNCGARMDAIAE